jgi:prepilin-type N-terminal cleavage/methylation domain-containing protein
LSVQILLNLRGQMTRSSNKRRNSGFTLIEVLIAITILAFCLCGLLATYVNMFFLTSLLRDSTLATSAVQSKLEEARNIDYSCLSTAACAACVAPCEKCLCDASEFAIDGIAEGKGVLEIEDVPGYTTLKKVRIVACFRSRGRVIGNDLDACASSPIEAITFISQ